MFGYKYTRKKLREEIDQAMNEAAMKAFQHHTQAMQDIALAKMYEDRARDMRKRLDAMDKEDKVRMEIERKAWIPPRPAGSIPKPREWPEPPVLNDPISNLARA